MRTHYPLQTITIPAAAALARNRFIGADGNYAGAGLKAVGVTEYDTDSGDDAAVHSYGIVLVEAGGVINAGALVKTGANGKALAATNLTTAAGAVAVLADAATPTFTGGVLPEAINGIALDAATADGDVIRLKLL